jgi:hypothetical protein
LSYLRLEAGQPSTALNIPDERLAHLKNRTARRNVVIASTQADAPSLRTVGSKDPPHPLNEGPGGQLLPHVVQIIVGLRVTEPFPVEVGRGDFVFVEGHRRIAISPLAGERVRRF